MKIHREGDKSEAICSFCEEIVSTTFKYRDVPFSDGVGFAKNVLVAVCDKCEEFFSIPSQSIPAIKKSRAKALRSVEVFLPSALIDALNVASYEIDCDFSNDFRKKAIWYFLKKYSRNKIDVYKIKKEFHLNEDKFSGGKGRLSFKVSDEMAIDLNNASEKFEENQTETIKIAAFDLFNSTIELKNRKIIKDLKEIAYMS